jgi:hypothetical protein
MYTQRSKSNFGRLTKFEREVNQKQYVNDCAFLFFLATQLN